MFVLIDFAERQPYPPSSLALKSAVPPEHFERCRQSAAECRIVMFAQRPAEDRPQVLEIGFDSAKPLAQRHLSELALCGIGQASEMRGMRACKLFAVSAGNQLLPRVLAGRFKEPIRGIFRSGIDHNQRFLSERC